jgi:multidrug efflux system outer membrane protein
MLSTERYNQGVSSYLEVLETERRLFATELTQSETRQLFLNAYVNLYKSLGGGWVTAADRQQLQEPANYH